jgi:hypothetical protein
MLRFLTTAAVLIASTVIVQAEGLRGNAGRSSAHVYMFTGLIGVGSGLDGLAGRIERRDVPSTMSSPGGADSLAQAAIDRYRSGRLRSIVIVGYSAGARSALEMAACLGAAKVPVKLLVTIDGMSGPPVSSNVRKLVNVFVDGGYGSAIPRPRRFAGVIENIPVSGVGHFSIIRAQEGRLFRYILAAAAEPPPAAPPPPTVAAPAPDKQLASGTTP